MAVGRICVAETREPPVQTRFDVVSLWPTQPHDCRLVDKEAKSTCLSRKLPRKIKDDNHICEPFAPDDRDKSIQSSSLNKSRVIAYLCLLGIYLKILKRD